MIETERLALRPWREADKPRFRAIINTPAMMTHFGGPTTDDALDALIDAQIAGQRDDGFSMWAVDWRASGEPIGICGLRRAHHAGSPVFGMLEAGWRIAEAYWRRGVAREAAMASINWGWAHTDDAAIVAYTSPSNEPSWRLMQKLGMRRRTNLDFRHPRFAGDDPLGEMIVYAVERSAA
ncbi:GNAT family N-acetyltransferase [Sphingomonas oligophenolica]|uniref:N-acetyltransferase n=1 Tax=Sphingomonas oligophenolica TaxID=301154 RepID=A0A502C5L8_9SPHN|nr:GNAT family N-acetyltransferase [Sphingomonas oligophenolica]TPG08477.1 N-acetyltransferase [Sphingomonas oligophenolica]